MKRASARAYRAPPPRGGAPARWPWGVVLALFLVRVWTGAFFCDTAKYKLFDVRADLSLGARIERFVEEEYVPMVQGAIERPPEVFGRPMTFFSDVLREVMLPAKDVLGPAVLFGEALLGISLVLGALVRLSASLGFLMMLCFSLAKTMPDGGHVYFFTANSANWPLTIVLLALAIAPAGRAWGLDRRLAHAGPRWLRWAC